MESVKLGKYLTLDVFCTCTQTYHRYRDLIAPFPENLAETIPALQDLNRFILDPIIDNFGLEKFNLTYGFCSKDLRKYLEQKNPLTGEKMVEWLPHSINIWHTNEIKMESISVKDRVRRAIFSFWGKRAISWLNGF